MAGADYSPLVIEHFERPRNTGRFEPAADVIEGRAGRPEQGCEFHVSARVGHDALIAVRISVYGCPHCIAAASWLSERLAGLGQQDLAAWSWREAAEALDVPAEKRGRMLILEDAVRHLAEAWRQRA
ncbi:MAG TPA: iron-sulfur cluster assembly scaffold protein [Povalibacter sp.]|nr:iron-sulfur cluster assembly scaffold protein [Povalibacter sp.]